MCFPKCYNDRNMSTVEFSEQKAADLSPGASAVLSQMKEHPMEEIRTVFNRPNYPEIQSIGENVSLAMTATSQTQLRHLVAEQIGAYRADPNVRRYWEANFNSGLHAEYRATLPQFSSDKVKITADVEQEMNEARLLEAKLAHKFGPQPSQDTEQTEPEDTFISWHDRRDAAVLLTQLRLAAFGQQQSNPTQNFTARMKGVQMITRIAFETMFPDPLAFLDTPSGARPEEGADVVAKMDDLLQEETATEGEVFKLPKPPKTRLVDVFKHLDDVLDSPEDLSA